MRGSGRKFSVAAVALAGAGFAMAATTTAQAAPATPKRHNVVVIMTDDQDFRSMHVMPKTRHLIAAQGTTFATNIISFPLCCPSRATFFTGQYAHNHGVKWNFFPQGGYYVLKQAETLPVWLQRAGYRTIHIGKYLNETDERVATEVPTGWTDYMGGVDPSTYDYYGFTINHNGKLRTYARTPKNYSTDVYAGLAEGAIRDATRLGKPFFLNVAPNAPHTVSAGSKAEVEGTPALPPPRYANRFAATPMPRYPNFDEADISDKPTGLGVIFPNPMTQEQIDSLTAHYQGRMGALLGVDDLVERVVKALKRNHVYANTDIIFTSDNGWILGEHRLRDPQTSNGQVAGVKYFPYEGSSRVPLMASGPDFPKNKVVNGVVVNADLAPTIEQITGAKPRLPQDGTSLIPAARRPSLLNGRGVLLETFPNPRNAPPYTSIRTERYRYDVQADGQEELFDLKLDPWELVSKHNDPAYADIKAILIHKLAALVSCQGAGCHVNVGKLPAPGA
ncbi:MAG: N-acetylglucosamine-6-sulfatase [Solirubrobacteraceae bacterium]|nr:N-acetylglucosamine-6-sulfatase [Solirubrobacteraceae bacterium]